MSRTVISVEKISKLYRLGAVNRGTFAQDLNRWWAKVRGKEDPYLKDAVENDRSKKTDSEYVWALKDISFEVKQGDVLGIIGRNGAGKSTLLKILTRVTAPTTGSIKARGRMASLLEVGTGFHPDLSGRDNIYLNGAILGMSKAEIKSKFDEIVDFSGVERYIDTPVKRYSSGMYVRLAFGVAAHLDPDIMIIDEVLAVGDMEFQKKCLGKIQDLNAKDGRTVLFVSHNMEAIRKLCTSGILLKSGGLLKGENNINILIENYLSEYGVNKEKFHSYKSAANNLDKDAFLLEAQIVNSKKEDSYIILFGEPFYIKMKWKKNVKISATAFSIRIYDESDRFITATNTLESGLELDPAGEYELMIKVPNYLAPQKYYITIGCFVRPHSVIDLHENVISFQVSELPFSNDFIFDIVGKPAVSFPFKWEIIN